MREILLFSRNYSICTKRLHRLLGQNIMHMLITYKLREIFLSEFLSWRIVLTLTLILPTYWKYSRTAVVNRTAVLAVEVDWLKSIKANLVVHSLPNHARLMADQFDEVWEGVVISLQVWCLWGLWRIVSCLICIHQEGSCLNEALFTLNRCPILCQLHVKQRHKREFLLSA